MNFGRYLGVASFSLLVLLAGPASARVLEDGSVTPSQWPHSPGLSPKIEGRPNGLRIHGGNRYETNLASALTFRSAGEFPFSNPDPSSAGSVTLAGASGWWGVGECPRSLVLVAGDSPADALTAASLTDPTGLSTEPYLRRSASADPLFDPVGGFGRVDTGRALILVTRAARAGGQELSLSTRVALQDLRDGGCTRARSVVIVGGSQAVSPLIEDELLSLGIAEVFRVAGANRFATAALVANSLGTSGVPEGSVGCADPSVVDGDARMGFYSNSVIEWRESAVRCELLGRTVVLADGISGVDALAAGWWSSYWQVPVLLHDGSNQLPDATAIALQTLQIENVLVLGGEQRISDSVAVRASELAASNWRRIAGADRYETSVLMAQILGGWWPSGSGDEFSSSMVCVAASSGSGTNLRGWADALGAGPWCASANGAVGSARIPDRALLKVNSESPRETGPGPRPSHDAVPIILVKAGDTALPPAVRAFLTASFEPGDVWCSSVAAPAGCNEPGFAIVFGGEAAVTPEIFTSLSALVGGRADGGNSPIPIISRAYLTELPQAPLFREAGTGALRICVPRDGIRNARWLIAGIGEDEKVEALVDLMFASWYRTDADRSLRTPGLLAPGCLRVDPLDQEKVWIRAVGLDGRSSQPIEFAIPSADRLKLSAALDHIDPIAASGLSIGADPTSGGYSKRVFAQSEPGVAVYIDDTAWAGASASISLELNRMTDFGLSSTDLFVANWSIETVLGPVKGTAAGEARLVGHQWLLRGETTLEESPWPDAASIGGFTGILLPGEEGLTDDRVLWRIDTNSGIVAAQP